MSAAGTVKASATTFEGLWEEIETDALNAWQNIKNEAVVLEQKFVPVIESDLTGVLSQLKTVAVQLVLALAGQEFANLTGTQKSAITTASILANAKALGTPIVAQDAAMLAQQAYNGVVIAAQTFQANAGH